MSHNTRLTSPCYSPKSHMKFPLLVLIAFLLQTFLPLHSQEKWRQLTAADGLSSNVF